MSIELKDRASAVVDARAADLVALSHAIHERPELGFEEHFAADLLADELARGGFMVERGAYDIDTAFVGRLGNPDGVHVVVCCEYDALPEIGHGCGHNIIAAAGVGAGLALAPLVEEVGGHLTVLGTPAEELGKGGKIALLERGAFDGADLAMMVHPSVADVGWAPHIATTHLQIEMRGKAAHAAAAPWEGVNALDGIVLGYTGVAALRQHLRPGTEKVHGIITHGGAAENVVPDYAAAAFQVRAVKEDLLDPLNERVLNCFRGAATQTGCEMHAHRTSTYEELWFNRRLADAYRANGERLGRTFIDPEIIPMSVAGSTDMGNVSKVVPSIHAMIRIADLDVPGHSERFRECAISADGDAAVIDGAKALAMTAIDAWTDPSVLSAARSEFDALRARQA